jgi:hypothetical protein
MPSIDVVPEPLAVRVDRLAAEAHRQGLALTRLPGNEWHLIPLQASGDWKLLSRQRQRLPDGRVLSIRMTIDEVEGFLSASPLALLATRRPPA